MSRDSATLDHMRRMLASGDLDKRAVSLLGHSDVLGLVVERTPESNRRVAQTSRAVRDMMSTGIRLPPAFFHVYLDQFPADTEEATSDYASCTASRLPAIPPAVHRDVWFSSLRG